MKQGIIHTPAHDPLQVFRFLKANGVRHHVPIDAQILVHGGKITVDTMDIERAPHALTLPRERITGRSWSGKWSTHNMPIKRRTYRIRHAMKDC